MSDLADARSRYDRLASDERVLGSVPQSGGQAALGLGSHAPR